MKIKHDLVILSGEVIPYIYIELIDDVEFSKEFWNRDDENSFISKLTRYVKGFLNNLNSDTAVLIINGVMIGTMSLSMLLSTYNKSVSENTCDMLNNSNEIVATIDGVDKEKQVSIEILKKATEEEKEILNKNISTYANVENKGNLTLKKEETTTSKESVSTNVNTSNSNTNIDVVTKPQESINNVQKPDAEENKTEVKEEIKQETENTTPEVVVPETPKQEVVEKPKEESVTPPVVVQGPTIRLSTAGTVVTMNLEEYILGVVGAEMPASFNTEALKAQAIAARTYAMKKTASGRILQDSVSDQVYETESELRNKWGSSFAYYYNKVKEAVNSTKGMVMMYGGNYIDALYHSMSNGKTELPKYIWNSNYPYLISVDSSWDRNVKNYEVTKTYDYNTVTQKLGVAINQDTNIEVLSYTESGRVNQINIGGSVFSGVDVRMKLGLRSADFTINKTASGLSITTRGYGHGVGMSQYGANEMAKQGYNYSQILTHYYTGISIVHV